MKFHFYNFLLEKIKCKYIVYKIILYIKNDYITINGDSYKSYKFSKFLMNAEQFEGYSEYFFSDIGFLNNFIFNKKKHTYELK